MWYEESRMFVIVFGWISEASWYNNFRWVTLTSKSSGRYLTHVWDTLKKTSICILAILPTSRLFSLLTTMICGAWNQKYSHFASKISEIKLAPTESSDLDKLQKLTAVFTLMLMLGSKLLKTLESTIDHLNNTKKSQIFSNSSYSFLPSPYIQKNLSFVS